MSRNTDRRLKASHPKSVITLRFGSQSTIDAAHSGNCTMRLTRGTDAPTGWLYTTRVRCPAGSNQPHTNPAGVATNPAANAESSQPGSPA